jgi:RNA polymerase primary sigma factor
MELFDKPAEAVSPALAEANQTKTIRQKEIVNNWFQNFNGAGYVEACTGFGKTNIGILAGELVATQNVPTLVIVPSRYLKKQWEERFPNARIEVVNGFVKDLWLEDWSNYLLIADECHHYTSISAETFIRVLSVNAKYKLFLSATLEKANKILLANLNVHCVGIVTEEEARENGWVSLSKEYNITIPFSTEEQVHYDYLLRASQEEGRYFEHDLSKARMLLGQARQNKGSVNGALLGHASRYVKLSSEMDNMCRNSLTKLDYARTIIVKLQEKLIKTIVFLNTIDSCLYLQRGLENTLLYHSKQKTKERRITMQKIEAGEFLTLINPKALGEGFDIPQLDCTLVVSGDSKNLQQVQRRGRSIRITNNTEKEALILNLVMANTHEERWVRMRQRNQHVLRVNSLEELPVFGGKLNFIISDEVDELTTFAFGTTTLKTT